MTKTRIVVHHSLTADGRTVSADEIERFHTSWRYGGEIVTPTEAQRLIAAGKKGVVAPWRDVGYHAIVERADDGIIAVLGRDWLADAAACPEGGMNEAGLHVCFVGNYDLTAPPDDLVEYAIRRVFRPWMRLFSIPASAIAGHRDFNRAKTCPGLRFDLDALRRRVA